MVLCVGVVYIIASVVGTSNQNGSAKPQVRQVSGNAPRLDDPATWALKTRATRDSNGGVVLAGSTNIPDGVKLMVQLPSGASSKIEVASGEFSSEPFTDKGTPMAAGPHQVSFIAYFNDAWAQPSAVVELTGRDGKKLQGKLFHKTDVDIVDSPKFLEYRTSIDFPPVSREAEAISLVKSAVLVVDGNRSSATIGDTVSQFLQPSTGIRMGKGWSAIQKSPDTCEVRLDIIDAANDGPAIWEADLRSHKVKYVNMTAKLMSYLPPD